MKRSLAEMVAFFWNMSNLEKVCEGGKGLKIKVNINISLRMRFFIDLETTPFARFLSLLP